MAELTEQIKQRAKELGADLVGIAPIERFQNAPLRMSPQGLLPEARSVVVAAIHHPDAAIELDGEPTAHNMGPYGMQGTMNAMLDDLSFWLGRFIEAKGFKTLPISASNIWRYTGYKDLKVNFAPDMAHRYAAVAAGLGEIGWSGLCLTPQFGPRNRFVSVVTEAELEPTPMYDGDPLCDQCNECVINCPTDAFRKEVKKMNRIEIGGRVFEFPETNKWRCAWAENFALNLAHKIPDKVDQGVILDYMEKYGHFNGEFGYCLRFCMTPEKRYYDAAYSRAPRRKKDVAVTSPQEMAATIKACADKQLIDVVAVAPKERFAGAARVHPEFHLPDVASVICLGICSFPGTPDTAENRAANRRRLDYAAFEITHALDVAGHSATTHTKIEDNLVAERLGIYDGNTSFLTILTSAAVEPQVRRRPEEMANLTPDALKAFCRDAGADLVGFFAAGRYASLCRSLEDAGLVPEEVVEIEDQAWHYGPFVPRVHQRRGRLQTLQDWLPGSASVIVLGLHFPDSALDIAKVTPAETVGPYAFVAQESLVLLRDTASRVIKRLNDAGYRAAPTYDVTGLASKTRNCRAWVIPDMRANVYEAVMAGLAYLGVHGHAITPQFGVRQRFIAIVTDAPLPSDDMLAVPSLCATCAQPCTSACPTAAIHGERKTLTVEGRLIGTYAVDCYACDWAKRYTLSGKEGPDWLGIDINVPVPAQKTTEAIVAAVAGADFGVQKRHVNITEECLRVCPARGGARK
jgi:epoxyqueuosine reductase QueG